MNGSEITIQGPDGNSFMGYLSLPKGGTGPGIVVLQEIFGVNQVMRDICDDLAATGFVALCPDLFWRIEPGVNITDQTEEELQKAFDLFQKFDVDAGMEDVQLAIDHLRGHEACTGKVGTIGFCLGGLLAYLSATRTDTDGSVGYYGVGIDGKLNEAANIKKPLMLHIATEDQFVNKEAQAKVKQGLAGNELVTLHVYEGMGHAFARIGGQHYDAEAALAANERSIQFLQQNL